MSNDAFWPIPLAANFFSLKTTSFVFFCLPQQKPWKSPRRHFFIIGPEGSSTRFWSMQLADGMNLTNADNMTYMKGGHRRFTRSVLAGGCDYFVTLWESKDPLLRMHFLGTIWGASKYLLRRYKRIHKGKKIWAPPGCCCICVHFCLGFSPKRQDQKLPYPDDAGLFFTVFISYALEIDIQISEKPRFMANQPTPPDSLTTPSRKKGLIRPADYA